MRFEDLDLEYEVLDGLEAMNFSETTPIQEATIPLLLEGRDMIACAQTGTGKTAAYLLPIINRLSLGQGVRDKVNAVIMAPTRELAVQIEQQVEGFSYFLPISCVAVYGGTDGITFEQQRRGLDMGVDIVIATPGRLISLLNLQHADLSSVSYFVLDEADRMLDMGFMDDIMQIHKALPETCQTVMFSATMPPKIKKLAKTILRSPAEVEIAISRPPESILQSAYICYERQKVNLLAHLFAETPPERTIVFCSSKLKCKELASRVRRMGINSAEMHSDLDQGQREQVMRDFKSGQIDLLIATDIVARGIDIDNIRMVINFDIPHDPEDYVHRIGRTARGGNDEGIAITLVGEDDQSEFGRIEAFLGKSVSKTPIPTELGDAPDYKPEVRRSVRGRGRSRSGVQSSAERSSSSRGKGRKGNRSGKPSTDGVSKPKSAHPPRAEQVEGSARSEAGAKRRRPKRQRSASHSSLASTTE